MNYCKDNRPSHDDATVLHAITDLPVAEADAHADETPTDLSAPVARHMTLSDRVFTWSVRFRC
jgi:hypothetical protein